MEKIHRYAVTVRWTGNTGQGTASYKAYERNHVIQSADKPPIESSSDPQFRGDRNRYNPEELFVSSVSSCHMLWYLHLCSEAGIVVTEYSDQAIGIMNENSDGSGFFSEIILRPQVIVKDQSMIHTADGLHEKAHKFCFLANSVNFPISHQPVTKIVE